MTNDEAIEILDAVRDVQINMEGHSAVTEALTYAIACLRESQWQPIETAPKDGTIIIIHGGIAYWRNDAAGGGWYSITGIEYPGRCLEWEPKYWQPLPQPPREGGYFQNGNNPGGGNG